MEISPKLKLIKVVVELCLVFCLAMRRLKRKTTVEVLWPYVLRLLHEKPMYAYELRQQIGKKFGWKPPLVTSYTVLYRLQRGGYVATEWHEQRGKPARKYYKITDKGKELVKSAEGYFSELHAKLFGKKT